MSRIDDLQGNAVLTTGASAGIGAALAQAFAAQGALAAPFHSKTPKELLDAMRNAMPLGRVGAFLFPVSNELSGYLTGNMAHFHVGTYMR